MRPLFFGTPQRRLYGVYDPPRGPDGGVGAVLCYPIGREYFRAHRACRFLSHQLAGRGVHVLRFDYLGTGDSSGEVEEYSPADWIDNVGEAVEELVDMAGLRATHVVGLRFGALLAAGAAQRRDDVSGVVLWDPVLDAEDCVSELEDDTYPEAFENALRAMASDGPASIITPTLVVTTDPEGRDRAAALAGRFQGDGTVCDLRHDPSESLWRESEDFGSVGMPADALRTITDWIAGSR